MENWTLVIEIDQRRRIYITRSLNTGRIRGLLWSACPLGSLGP